MTPKARETDFSASTTVRVGSPLRRMLWRIRGVYGIFFCLILLAGYLFSIIMDMSATIQRNNDSMYRSAKELIHGGKVFINFYYSLNAATVEYDQYRAIKMLSNSQDRADRQKYLDTTDLVRRTIRSGLMSTVDWRKSSVRVIDKTDHSIRVEYLTYINRTNYELVKIDVILTLEPALKTDDNTEGVGVLLITNIASNPFNKDNQHAE